MFNLIRDCFDLKPGTQTWMGEIVSVGPAPYQLPEELPCTREAILELSNRAIELVRYDLLDAVMGKRLSTKEIADALAYNIRTAKTREEAAESFELLKELVAEYPPIDAIDATPWWAKEQPYF